MYSLFLRFNFEKVESLKTIKLTVSKSIQTTSICNKIIVVQDKKKISNIKIEKDHFQTCLIFL